MIDPDPVVFWPGTGLIIPETVKRTLVGGRTHRVHKPKIFQTAKRLSRLRQEQRITRPGHRVVAVIRLGNHVVIASENQRLLKRQPLFGKGAKPLHPAELVGVFDGSSAGLPLGR